MGRIKKAASQKHEATISPYLTDFVARATSVPIPELPTHLNTFSRLWPFPRGDLYHWINVLNRFDEILASVIEKYALNAGPQTKPFGRHVLVDSYATGESQTSPEDADTKLDALGYGPEGDRELVEVILDFSRLLLEKCGNRSLYNSSERLGELLNTTSFTLLQSTLRLSLCLAQRYHSRQRGGSHLQQSLLAAHYNIDLEKLQKIAAPIPRPYTSGKPSGGAATGAKGKEKGAQTKNNANDLISITRETDGWDEWGHVRLIYYPSSSPEPVKQASEAPNVGLPPQPPTTPTPLRRSHTHPTPHLTRTTIVDDSPSSITNSPSGKPEEALRGGKILDIPYAKISSSKAEDLLASHLGELPNESKYELLHRIRTAQGLVASSSSREEILAIRLLAITNLAYVYPETLFQQKILQYDMEQPKRLQLAFQLGELVHLGASGDLPVSRILQTIGLYALDALAKHKSRAIDVCAALSVNVNHGILMFLTRKVVNELASEERDKDEAYQDEWRDALLALLRTLPGSSTRTPETLVSAGLIPMFVDILNLRTEKARRVYSRVMEFLDTFVHAVRDALATLTNAKGFDAISDLIDYETKTSFESVSRGEGLPPQHKTPSIDYQIPYFQQQTLRWMFRFVNHIMQHNGGGFDRVLRNLIDSPQLLTSLRLVFENAQIFGSHVWSNAVNILSSFIHNEPTSYAVIAEAGLSKSFLEAVTSSEIKTVEKPAVETTTVESTTVENTTAETIVAETTATEPEIQPQGQPSSAGNGADTRSSARDGQNTREYSMARSKDARLAPGIMSAAEALSCIPSAFGAICLNSSGLELFQSSNALESFFEIFENPQHVKCLKDDHNLVRALGTTFDELVRHHPALKSSIMTAVIVMVARVGLLCKSKAWAYGMGTKMWVEGPEGQPTISGDRSVLALEIGAPADASLDNMRNLGIRELTSATLPDGGKLNLGDLSQILPSSSDSVEPQDQDAAGLTVTDYLYPVVRFLGAFFENQANCSFFIESGGVEFVLDFATLQSLPFDFHNSDANQELTVLVHMLAETKPHLVLPSLLTRAETAVNNLAGFWSEPKDSGFFTPLIKSSIDTESESKGKETELVAKTNGTYYARHIAATLVLTDLLREIFSMPLYQTRPSQHTSAFAQVNLADRYCSLVSALGSLHAACVWEEILLERNIPATWDQATKVQATAGAEKSNEPSGTPNAEGGSAEPSQEGATTIASAPEDVAQDTKVSTAKVPEDGVAFKNVRALRYLLSSLPSSITGFFHNLGLGLIGKRRVDSYQRQNATLVADAISGAVLKQLQFGPANSSDSTKHRFAYLIVILSSFSHLLYEATAERPHSHYLTLVLFAFKRQNGLKIMKNICDIFMREVKALTPPESVSESESDVSARLTSAYGGIKIILSFFAELASGKNIVDSSQTQTMTTGDRDRDRPDYFQPGQFLVDLRMEILPMAREMWNSDFTTQSSSSVVKCLVEILRSSLDGEYETGAARRSEPPPYLAEATKKKVVTNKDRVTHLHQDKGFDKDLATEALYRCNNVYLAAEEYCKAQNWLLAPPRVPPNTEDIDSSSGETSEDTAVGDAPPFNSGFLERSTLAMLLAQASGRSTDDDSRQQHDEGRSDGDLGNGTEFLARALTQILNDEQNAGTDDREGSSYRNIRSTDAPGNSNSSENQNQSANASSEQHADQTPRRREITTVEDLDAEREKVRSNLIERCLDVLNEHHDVSFELSDLIASATKKHRDPESFRREVGEILVQSLVSLQMENFQAAGKKVAAYAHLLALVLQDREMYNATLDELKECFTTFLGFIKVSPEQSADESFPWIGHVLLILEKLLSDDAQPPQIRWNMPDGNNPTGDDEGPAQLEEPLVSLDQKTQLYEAIIEILPRTGKDDTLALSVCRILVILTRNRSIATRLGEKRSLQRLFVMVKQLSSSTNEKLQSAFMLILRHIIEDEDTIRQIMRSEIVANFESKSSRQIDTTGYVRQMYHLVLRSPELFVEVTNEKLKLQRYDNRQRPQTLTLKADKISDSAASSSSQGGSESTTTDKAPAEASPSEDKEKGKIMELKPPVVENPDGVIHYLLSELLSYKDVDDKEIAVETTDTSVPDQSETQTDVEMSTDEPSPSVSSSDLQGARTSKKTEKPPFKADEHPIYIYRCFLLQCLTELLSSYNRTKVEFINFSRKADPHATTPSKPRSGILNYLLNVLVPIGTMEHDESVSFKKRSNTSAWTMRVLVALCTKTGEFGGPGRRRNDRNATEEDEPELTFVRRFVLEHALRAYKEANISNEPLDMKYSRLMSLADLFDKMLSGYAFVSGDTAFPSSTRQLAKTMFEKHFISALTASIAEIDLNFPTSKRVIKYILRPLNKLTQTAVILSESSDISSLGDTEDDEISSATSVSDIDDDREETPDLFRHSTLGMLEPRHEEETSSEESEEEEDDEMYDDEYGDEMDYDEDMPEDDGEVVSDEEDDIEGIGPIEGLPGDSGMDIEVVIDEDEDDEDDEDDDDEDESDMDDDEILAGEITGDQDNDSLEEGDEDEWESEDMSEDDEEAEIMNQFEDELADIRQADHRGDGQRFDDLFRVLNEAAGGVEDLQADSLGDVHDDMADDDLNEDDDDEEIDELEEELDAMDDDEGSYQGFDDDDDLIDPWGWDGDEAALHRGHHQRFRGTQPAWAAVTGMMPNRHGIVPIQPYRFHRTQVPSRGNDDGTNPLLVRTDRGAETTGQPRGPGNEAFTDWVHGMEPISTGRLLPMDSSVSFMNAIMQAISGQSTPGFGVITRPDGIHVHVDRRAILPNRSIQDIFGLGRPQAPPARTRDDPSQAVSFALATTRSRWQEEARILFSSTYVEKTQRVVNSLLKILVPPAIEEEKQREKLMEEERKRREEERAERERQERIAKEEEEKERKRKEEEENARRQQERQQQEAERQAAGLVSEPMDDVQETAAGEITEPSAQPEAGPSEPARRVHTTIRGRQLDITELEIDPEYLEALPEELREEVIMQQLAEQRSQAAAAGEEPSEINQEFLEALPADIREELLQQEAADRRRRERESARRQVPPVAAPAHAEEMDAASFLATLDPSLRQAVLADQPEEILATLGPEFVSEAHALPGRRLAQFGDITRADNRPRNEPAEEQESKKPQRRQIVQMLDKAGIATLLRLMFMPLQGNARHQLNDILHNVCENRQNRVEVISLLLSILQDGSVDVTAIERSFSHLSFRAKPGLIQKTPQSAKRNMAYQTSASVSSEVTPTMVVQQCLGTLSFLSQYNPHIAWFFLTEHDPSSTSKLKSNRKGKGKEGKASKFALNALLNLLDRKLIMENPNCMEQLSSLLSSITQPLTLLLRREKERQEEEDKGKKTDGAPAEEPIPDQGQSAQPAEPTGPSADTTMTDAPAATVEATEQQAATATAPEDAAAGEVEKTEAAQETSEDGKPKRKIIEPPVVPDENLRLVVHILAARECNGKTFRETLSTINNLSAIPGARDVIGNELVNQALSLCTTILTDLDELLSHIHQARTGTDMQGLALAKFSPASSDQAKLLRVLTALDYLFDPNRADKVKGSEPEATSKDDVLQTLYESSTFGPLWTKLSECLTVIRQKENMLNVATILLPLIEALMVVCKNTTLKDTTISRNSRELSVSTTSADNGVNMESLFFRFTEEHRKILNELVRQNPRLMSGSFSLLVKNPKVLEFDNKRNYFTRKIHSRGAEPRHPHPPLQLSVRRDQVFLDSFKSLYFKSADELKYGKLNVRFHGEEGVDAGGVTREWFQVLARGMFNPNYALFIPVAADRTTFHPNRLSGVNSEHLMFFKFIGRIIGKALYEGRVLDCHFSRAVYKCILSRSVSIKDMETLDLDYYKSLLWMLENDITDIITETFAVETDDFGEKQVIDLIENGSNIPVTQENKEEYVQRVVDYRLVKSVKDQLDNFLNGFHEIIPPDLISIFNEQELELLISGLPEIDVDDWKANTEYHNYSASSPQIQWFWRAVRSFDKEERAKLLQFVTGTSKVPLNGFKELEGMNGVSKFNIHRDYGNKDRLPSSHTCFNQLDLPEYENYETLRQRLYTAITAGSEYFGFA
ncbi:E3 ubiquitin-protein ligase TOM1 [Aspergillus clavatus NRRL 1]|uniref:HECT-type E3 ubiquitin transferase n=1 Tax=Aspergillus clavatus (strain ATCC 1007 / CBS 513.65 / DSM 816 / NCTC 3887 / NRRL 1 / QM 1276 / 107) TaxID=344612 RepID=A1CI18_ASPCL|nr:ubiquitin-protein ligase (Tom1), putative [Aspergillus clavatus NRRL 1]EAW10523.1 ubiquitin-protein ligase (Tom1), putative [Aspergillus clavatus NRRL 1]